MNIDDLSPAMRVAYNALATPEEREAFLEEVSVMRRSMIQGATSAIMARNQSHGLGEEIREIIKEKDPEE
jgi:hypothetical protein